MLYTLFRLFESVCLCNQNVEINFDHIECVYCICTNKICLEVRRYAGHAAGFSNWAQLALAGDVLRNKTVASVR
jgi:hypothetical protein